jgi:molybdopterin synthase sulfur carrier subunit
MSSGTSQTMHWTRCGKDTSLQPVMITVHVKLFATLREYRPGLGIGEAFPVELPEGATVGDLVRHLGLPEKEIKIVFVNALVRELDHVLADGDELGMFPPVGGG